MAFTPVVPGTFNVSMFQGLAQLFTAPALLNAAGSAINLSAWTSLTAIASAAVAGPNTADVTFGTVVGGAAGLLTLQTSASDLAAVESGTARLIITGKPTSGDAAQILYSGSLTVNKS